MRVGIDARGLQRVERGIPLYTRRLCEELPAQLPGASFVLFTNDEFPYNVPKPDFRPRLDAFAGRGMFEIANGNTTSEEYWEQVVLPRLAHHARVDMIFMPGNRVPVWTSIPVVATFHDVMERVFIQQVVATPAHASMRMRAYFVRQRAYIRLVYSMGLRRAAHVITGTDNARHDLTKLLKVPDRKITRIYHGRDDAFARATPVPRSERPYTLMLGGDVFQKNADGAIKAWSLVPPEVRQRHPLRVIGFAGKDDSPLLKTMRECRLTNEVTIEGWLSSEDVVSRFQHAALFLFLSHHEGFGFPIVHAMTAGTPVVHSSTSCLPEVAGGAGLACKPSDARAIAAAITKVLTDDVEWGLCQRRGLARSGQFNWTESAAAHAQVFSRVVRPKTQGRTP